MSSPAEAESPERSAPSAPSEGVGPGPVAVVWCRQVDNEAESPGYTSVPEEFPGRRETLDLIRLVGNLTVNVADTHDYWTPGPPQALSYYPNLFLYPAFGGRYTCVGRMFLSTEDRPRLGMKTLVLDTSQLLASGEFGASVLRWYATMAGARSDGRRPPVPEPGLYPMVGEGLLFHRGSTEPVVLVASTEWDAVMEVIFDLVRQLPASLVMLGAILAFPYFLPQPKTNLHEFAEQVPLALSLMRIPPSEAVGDRHRKRLQSWEATSFTFHDLTEGLPGVPPRAKESVPLVLQYVRDRNAPRLGPIVQRVDLVELPKLRSVLADPERQSGKERRKEMWRIGTAMESAALLLQRGRGRHLPVSVESAKRAQEYLRAELPRGEVDAGEAEGGAPALPPAEASPTAHPSWLARGGDIPVPSRGAPEVVPVSSSDDPSLQPIPAPAARSAPAPPALAGAALEREVEAAIGRVLGPRLHQVEEELVRRLASEIDQAVGAEVDRRADQVAEARFRTLIQATETQLAQTLTSLDTRWQEKFAAVTQSEERRVASGAGLREELAHQLAAQERSLGAAVEQLESRLRAIEAEFATKVTGLLAATEGRLRDSLPSALATEIDRRLRATIDRDLADSPRGEKGAIAGRIDGRIDSAVRLSVQGAVGQIGRSVRELEQRWEERLRAMQAQNAPLGAKALESVLPVIDRRITEAIAQERGAVASLREQLATRESSERAALGAELERRIAEAVATEAEARGESEERQRRGLADALGEVEPRRLKELRELESRLTALFETRTKEGQGRLAASAREFEARLKGTLDERIAQVESRVAKSLEARVVEGREQQAHVDADLQVRLQSYTDQKLREVEERLRATTVELLARLRSDVDGSLARIPDAQRLESTYKDRLQRTTEALRSELQLAIDHRLSETEDRLRQRETDAVGRVENLERDIQEQTKGLLKVEDAVRAELDDLDRRLVTLSDRLLPVMRKTWLRVAELEKAPGGAVDVEPRLGQLRRELKDELRRVDAEFGERLRDLRDRMETTIAHQGKVWLTVIRQLSQLTEDRRAASGPPFPPLAAGPLASSEEDATDEEEEAPEEEPPPRRRLRRAGRSSLR
jgi:hypothetical protein